jgi:hypothetical protein
MPNSEYIIHGTTNENLIKILKAGYIESVNNNLKIVKSFDYVERKPTVEQIRSIIKNNADYYIFAMDFNFNTGFTSVLLNNPN